MSDRDYRYIAVVGSRDYPDREEVESFVRDLDPRVHVVVSGGAPGVDSWAVQAAEAAGIHTCVVKALWKHNQRSAGFIRNPIIIDIADRVVAYRVGGHASKGTTHAIQCAHDSRTPIEVIDR